MAGMGKKPQKVFLTIIFFVGCLLSFHKVASPQEPVTTKESISTQESINTQESITAQEPVTAQEAVNVDQNIKALEPEDASMKWARRSLAGASLKDGFSVPVSGSGVSGSGVSEVGDSGSGDFGAGGEDTFDLHLGGSFQVDYRYYQENSRADNCFDIRQARLFLSGSLNHFISYRIEYELQGNDSQNLIEVYGEWEIIRQNLLMSGLRIGQFKEPYGLECQTRESALFFVERSMGYYLTPQRDVGLMFSGSSYHEIIQYAAGLFNGDGRDGSTKGSRNDQLEVAARLVLIPFPWSWLESLQIGGSLTQSRIDLSNVALEVKSSGMAGTSRCIFVLNQNTKFGLLQKVKERDRWALEAGWSLGPLAVQGEYLNLKYKNLESSGGNVRDADFSSWYGSALLFFTGESPVFKGGVLQPVKPKNNLDWSAGTWGGLVLATRVDHFSGDKAWIKKDAFISVEKANAYSVALNWIMNPMLRLIIDYTYTDFSDHLRVRVNPDGKVDYIYDEHVLTTRFHIAF